MGVEPRAAVGGRRHLAQAVGEKAQPPLGRQRGIELAHRAGGGVARVDEGLGGLVAGGHALAHDLVQALEIVAAHIDLAAHFEQRRHAGSGFAAGPPQGETSPLGGQRSTRSGKRGGDQTQRDLADGADVVRDVFAGFAVAARGGLHQHAAFVAQAHGQAVELGFGHVVDGRAGQHGLRGRAQRLAAVALVVELEQGAPLLAGQIVAHALIEGGRALGRGVGFGADAEHGHGVAHRCQRVEHGTAHALGGRVGRAQRGVFGLDGLQLAKQAVVLGVGQFGRVERVVLVGGAVQPGPQLGRSSAYVCFVIHSCSRTLGGRWRPKQSEIS